MFFKQSCATKMKLVTTAVVDPDVAGVTRGFHLAVCVTCNKNALSKVEQANKATSQFLKLNQDPVGCLSFDFSCHSRQLLKQM